ncbi:hypothetical protein NTE_01212 [Candidatus Nitrososphaera evergladensis SR1]|uniref:Pycsar effector protein domain-containing protein n=1 Tax=Candidatus Nitrososphaera evergladensis SR1 TaxID=1459636 RepID=A0A075MVJ1_9ARCH|nr:hypothetical protein [Candidatus Nitrososphaera evergladensis]AIF83284.1 hypothetical protein NTE_01212 [Candidatus Nitrososphaera evergladensis SR1]
MRNDLPNQNGDLTDSTADLFREDLKAEYEKDFEIKERIDNKASNMITMAGVIAAIFTGFGAFVLKDAALNWILGASIVAMFLELLFLIKTILSASNAYKIAEYKHVLMYSQFIQDDKFNNVEIRTWKDAERESYNSRMIKDYLDASYKNTGLNEEKIDYLKESQRAFLYAVIMIPIAAVLSVLANTLK